MISQEKQNIIVNYLKVYQPEMIGIFGSYARGENRADSDLDILISIKKPIGLLEFVRMQRELSELLGVNVDLVTERSIRNETLKKYIYQDLQVILD
ncbi:MAG TPA: nucleotidyltransferase family protein [Bacteroidia bacterium]|nr:nucleotidyltransferase family protein [Bacteroidia bacterium]